MKWKIKTIVYYNIILHEYIYIVVYTARGFFVLRIVECIKKMHLKSDEIYGARNDFICSSF